MYDYMTELQNLVKKQRTIERKHQQPIGEKSWHKEYNSLGCASARSCSMDSVLAAYNEYKTNDRGYY